MINLGYFGEEGNQQTVSINYFYIGLQVIFLVMMWFIERLVIKITKEPTKRKTSHHYWWIWTLVLWILIVCNLGYYWPAYPIALWMIWALVLITIQIFHHHEFIYRRYWPIFWKLSAYYALIVYVLGVIFAHWLPLI